ncbi:MAG TPA: hypothetical protein VGO37_21405 [Steroidobacteraceae bacterium]|jgi:hypothetical protein|nr:hypothetical protein [Steroidobacteraceae bacterium]
MYRRKVVLTAAAVFAIAVAFAAQPTSLRADWGEGVSRPGSPWVPGTNTLMSAQEESISILAPPR